MKSIFSRNQLNTLYSFFSSTYAKIVNPSFLGNVSVESKLSCNYIVLTPIDPLLVDDVPVNSIYISDSTKLYFKDSNGNVIQL